MGQVPEIKLMYVHCMYVCIVLCLDSIGPCCMLYMPDQNVSGAVSRRHTNRFKRGAAVSNLQNE